MESVCTPSLNDLKNGFTVYDGIRNGSESEIQHNAVEDSIDFPDTAGPSLPSVLALMRSWGNLSADMDDQTDRLSSISINSSSGDTNRSWRSSVPSRKCHPGNKDSSGIPLYSTPWAPLPVDRDLRRDSHLRRNIWQRRESVSSNGSCGDDSFMSHTTADSMRSSSRLSLQVCAQLRGDDGKIRAVFELPLKKFEPLTLPRRRHPSSDGGRRNRSKVAVKNCPRISCLPMGANSYRRHCHPVQPIRISNNRKRFSQSGVFSYYTDGVPALKKEKSKCPAASQKSLNGLCTPVLEERLLIPPCSECPDRLQPSPIAVHNVLLSTIERLPPESQEAAFGLVGLRVDATMDDVQQAFDFLEVEVRSQLAHPRRLRNALMLVRRARRLCQATCRKTFLEKLERTLECDPFDILNLASLYSKSRVGVVQQGAPETDLDRFAAFDRLQGLLSEALEQSSPKYEILHRRLRQATLPCFMELGKSCAPALANVCQAADQPGDTTCLHRASRSPRHEESFLPRPNSGLHPAASALEPGDGAMCRLSRATPADSTSADEIPSGQVAGQQRVFGPDAAHSCSPVALFQSAGSPICSTQRLSDKKVGRAHSSTVMFDGSWSVTRNSHVPFNLITSKPFRMSHRNVVSDSSLPSENMNRVKIAEMCQSNTRLTTAYSDAALTDGPSAARRVPLCHSFYQENFQSGVCGNESARLSAAIRSQSIGRENKRLPPDSANVNDAEGDLMGSF